VQIKDPAIDKTLSKLISRFNECTRIRNEFNHCMYMVDDHGEITHTHSIKIIETRKKLKFGEVRAMDDKRLKEMVGTTRELKALNRDIWNFLPRLDEHLNNARPNAQTRPARSKPPK
jgi:hypothetical protein